MCIMHKKDQTVCALHEGGRLVIDFWFRLRSWVKRLKLHRYQKKITFFTARQKLARKNVYYIGEFMVVYAIIYKRL